MPTGRKKKCIAEGCEREQVERGLCDPCCQAARRKIRSTKNSKKPITWESLEKLGLALPEATVRSNANPTALAIDKAFAAPSK